MQATRLKVDPWKNRCDRCQQTRTPIHECVFTFRHPFAYWKSLYSAETGKRLTNRRKNALAAPANPEHVPFDWKQPPAYYIDLCDACFAEVAKPWDGFPSRFDAEVLFPPGHAAKR